MTRYFFDVNTKNSIRYDYSGCLFPCVDGVHEMAELVAIDVACTEVDQSVVMEVHVRDAAGQKLFAIPVRLKDALAA